jgi:hypothetical protein
MKRLVFALVWLASCGDKAPPDTAIVAVDTAPPPPIACAEGALLLGKSPPFGFAMTCNAQDPARPGTWFKQGPAITWHPDGSRASLGQYELDKKHGYWQTWFADGQVETQGTYSHDVPTGVWTAYHATAAKKSEGEYTGGKMEGHWSYWHSNGQLKTEGEMSGGEYQGVWLEYDETGRALSEREYREGRLIRQRQL